MEKFDDFAAEVQGSGLHVNRINMVTYGDSVRASGITHGTTNEPVSNLVRGYPTLLFFRKDGTNTRMYNGPRTTADVLDAVKQFYPLFG